MHILTSASIREADRRTIREVGVPASVLMESAGRAVVRTLIERIEDLASRSVVIVCGKGGNGGDGLVVLRTLANLGYDARAVVLAPFENLSAEALDNLQAALKLGLAVESAPTAETWADVLAHLAGADVVVDALFGTGLTEPLRALPRQVIEDMNSLDTIRVALDVPSGLSSDTGAVPGVAFDADLTVALAAPKVCHFLPPASELCGEVVVVEIGIPPRFLESSEPKLETIDPSMLAMPRRKRVSHKGTYGHLLILAGSRGKAGAAVMAAEAALRSGVGLVTVASAESAIPMMAQRLPEAMWEALPETHSGAVSAKAEARVRELLRDRQALALGPGLGTEDDTVALVCAVVSASEIPTVVDADGLNALARDAGRIPAGRALALTPHPGEAGRLLGSTVKEIESDRLASVRELARRTKAHVLLKGHRTLVSDPRGNVLVNLTGNPGMATGGTGDVLTGILGSLLAQGVDIEEALPLGVHVHGLAGDLAAADVGETSLVATDLIEKLPAALRSLGAD
ncbi:MAG TPA: NAD(P)H-hydrate dehydratase [Vicinamibacteria bacterium]|nr:NAD(P)H-hydrate dehydratase [Vicinamibacteria bacterium]